MIILSVHNSYQQPGGEDEVFRQEARLLEQHGHQVIRYQAHNDDVAGKSSFDLLAKTIYNREAYGRVRSLIKKSRPDVMHVHNTFPLLSPAVYYAAAGESVPVVQTLHNYRLLCPAAVLFRDNAPCERCLDTLLPWPAIRFGCYRGSRPASAAAASMLAVHRLLKTFGRKITTYIALSDFARSKFARAGIPMDKIQVKPNFIQPDPGRGDGSGGFCLFVGRLAPEKGLRTMLDAWTRFSPPLPLEIAGDGDLAREVAAAAERCPRIRWLGRLQTPQLYERMKKAAALIVPSTWYESFPVVLVEAFSMGLPVIASKLGAMATIVEHGRTGLHFVPGDAAGLASQVNWFHNHPQEAREMREQARVEFVRRYTGERNYSLLMEIYRKTLERYGSDKARPAEVIAPNSERVDELVQIAAEVSPRVSLERNR